MTDYQQNEDSESSEDESDSSKKTRVDDSTQVQPYRGLWLLSSVGKVKSVGSVEHLGSAGRFEDGNPAVAIVANKLGTGYWIIYANGFIEPSGTAIGFEGTQSLDSAITSAVCTSDHGILLALANGSVKALGTAEFLGSALDLNLDNPIVNIALSKNGYWLLSQSGRVINCGDTQFLGSATEAVVEHNSNAVSIAAHPAGDGYWIALSDGFVVTYGRSIFYGRVEDPVSPIVSVIATHDGNGYWLIDATGNVFPFGEIANFDTFLEDNNQIEGTIVSATPVS
jgi:hypothetical protein